MGLATTDSGNILVQNFGLNPAVNFNFMLRVEALYDLPCKSVRVFQRENEYELIQEGGLNDYVHMRRKPISKPFTFQVERYVGTDILDPLANGTELALPIILYVNKDLVYREFIPVRCYVFTGCTVTAKEYGELNAEKSGLLVETTTIAYREMFCMENVVGSYLTLEPWKFDGRKKEGNSTQYANYNKKEQELSKSEMQQKAKIWDFDENGDFKGINQSAQSSMTPQLSKKEMKKKAVKWPAKASAVDIATFLARGTENK